jgi:hypothetical protein
MSGHCRRRIAQNFPPTEACHTLVKMVGNAISAMVSDSGSTNEVSAMVIVGNPSPTSPFTVPASRNTASARRMSSVVTSPPSSRPEGRRPAVEGPVHIAGD